MRIGRYALLAALALGGCGESADEDRAASGPTPASTPRPVSTNDPRTQEIREAANRYLSATARADWSAVCATLARSERGYFDRLGGSCEAVYGADSRRKAVRRERRLIRNARAGDIRVKGDGAVIDVHELGWREVLFRLYAIEENGRWGIARREKLRDA